MTIMSNRSILEKADLALSDLVAGGGLLKPAQARQFLQMVTKESTLLRQVTAVPMKAPKQEIPFVGFRDRILRPRQESTALTQAQRTKPDFNMVELDSAGHARLSKTIAGGVVARQQAPAVYSMNASVYVWWRHTLDKGLWDGRARLHVMPRERSIDVDSLLDFELVQLLMMRARGAGEGHV